MEKGVYVYDHKERDLRQVTFINVIPNGYAYGVKEYVIKRITFTLVDPKSIFPAFLDYKYTEEEEFDFSPLLISSESKMNSLSESSPMYKFYTDNYVLCNISFRFIEHLYENFNSIKNTFKNITKELEHNYKPVEI